MTTTPKPIRALKRNIGDYRPGTIVISSRSDVYFIAAALSDEHDDVFLSERKYSDQSKALAFAEDWFFRNA